MQRFATGLIIPLVALACSGADPLPEREESQNPRTSIVNPPEITPSDTAIVDEERPIPPCFGLSVPVEDLDAPIGDQGFTPNQWLSSLTAPDEGQATIEIWEPAERERCTFEVTYSARVSFDAVKVERRLLEDSGGQCTIPGDLIAEDLELIVQAENLLEIAVPLRMTSSQEGENLKTELSRHRFAPDATIINPRIVSFNFPALETLCARGIASGESEVSREGVEDGEATEWDWDEREQGLSFSLARLWYTPPSTAVGRLEGYLGIADIGLNFPVDRLR